MGFNSTMIVLNDALHDIAKDPEFGKKVETAILQLSREDSVDIGVAGHVNAATVLNCHHADYIEVIAIGGNTGTLLGSGGGWRNMNDKEAILKALADQMGYRIVKKRQPKAKKAKPVQNRIERLDDSLKK